MIGVTPLWDAERQSVWMLPDYLDGIKAAGGLPVVLPLEMSEEDANQVVEACNGFLFTGGQDVSPKLYGMKDVTGTITASPERDKMETLLLLRHCKPIKLFWASVGDFSSSTCFWAARFGRTFPRSILRKSSTGKASLTVSLRIKSN